MRIPGLALAACLALGAHGQAVRGPAVQVDFSNPAMSPSHWTLILHRDGSGHFHSQMGKPPSEGRREIDAPNLDRDVQVSARFAGRVFDTAQRHNWFNESCESHLKVAFQGWKKLSYTGPEGSGSCTFNYSKDREIQNLGDSLQAVAETILEGERLEMLLEHDPLGLDKEMEYLVEAVDDGRAQQICAIRGILQKLVQDESVMERVRKRARILLEQSQT